jgi:hypothetical protein
MCKANHRPGPFPPTRVKYMPVRVEHLGPDGSSWIASWTVRWCRDLPPMKVFYWARPRHRRGHHPVGDLDRRTGRRHRARSVRAVPGGGDAAQQHGHGHFSATQTYSDGTAVHWDQPPKPGGGEAEYPVPTLTLTAAPSASATQSASPSASASPAPAPAQASSRPAPDSTARWLAGAALVVGALGVGLTLVLRRRS